MANKQRYFLGVFGRLACLRAGLRESGCLSCNVGVVFTRWTGITVSKEQLAEATARVKVAGLSDSITLLFCDYR